GLKRVGDLLRYRQRFADRDWTTGDYVGQILAWYELHGEGMYVSRLFESKDLGDIRMIQCRKHLGFALEAAYPVRVRRKRFRQDLDRHVAIEFRIAGSIHRAHAALSYQREDFVHTKAAPYERRALVSQDTGGHRANRHRQKLLCVLRAGEQR